MPTCLEPEGRRAERAVQALGLALLAIVLARTAWVCDDAYITLRTVDNFVNGLGLRWSVDERVQAYTHPLWMFALAGLYFFTREAYFTVIALSMALTIIAAALLMTRVARRPGLGMLALALLLFSRAFIDYSSSGLENPLTHLLLALFVLALFREPWNARALLLAAFLAALTAINRMDASLLLAPALLHGWWRGPRLRGIPALAVGLMPFVAWEVFSLVYYGFPFPNTAYAKLGTGIPHEELVRQGWFYLVNAWRRDPLTPLVLGAGFVSALARRDGRAISLALGLPLYLAYVVWIGGDFMAGRFLTAPYVIAVALVVGWPAPQPVDGKAVGFKARLGSLAGVCGRFAYVPLLAGAAWLGLGMPSPKWPEVNRPNPREIPAWDRCVPNVFSDSDHGRITAAFKDEHGIGDERLFYFQDTGLLQYQRNIRLPKDRFSLEGRAYQARGDDETHVHGSVGFRGYFAGAGTHIIDYYALGDALLARLPAAYSTQWRIGHFGRAIPAGYEQAVSALHVNPTGPATPEDPVIGGPPWRWPLWGVLWHAATTAPETTDAAPAYDFSALEDPDLAAFASRLALITRGPIWSRARWEAICRMNLGQYDHLIKAEPYRFPSTVRITLQQLEEAAAQAGGWAGTAGIAFAQRGICVTLGGTVNAPAIAFDASAGNRFRLLVMRGLEIVTELDATPGETSDQRQATYRVTLPGEAAEQGYDTIRLYGLNGVKSYRLYSVKASD